jgi:hypothetical protein
MTKGEKKEAARKILSGEISAMKMNAEVKDCAFELWSEDILSLMDMDGVPKDAAGSIVELRDWDSSSSAPVSQTSQFCYRNLDGELILADESHE